MYSTLNVLNWMCMLRFDFSTAKLRGLATHEPVYMEIRMWQVKLLYHRRFRGIHKQMLGKNISWSHESVILLPCSLCRMLSSTTTCTSSSWHLYQHQWLYFMFVRILFNQEPTSCIIFLFPTNQPSSILGTIWCSSCFHSFNYLESWQSGRQIWHGIQVSLLRGQTAHDVINRPSDMTD